MITAYFDRGDEQFSDGVYRIGRDLTIPMNGAFVNITIGTRLAKELRQIEAAEQFDLVHIHSPLDPVLPLVALRTIRAPKVGTFHSYTEKSIGYVIFGTLLKRGFANRLAARIAVSEAAKEFASRYFPGDYRVIPNGVDVARFNPNLAPVAMLAGAENILFVGRMDPRKGLKYLIQAFPEIAAARPNARLIIVGGGFLAGYYKRFITDSVRDRIRFEGFVSGKQLPHYFAAATVFCSPATKSESFGIVLIEALAAGKPIVAFANRGYDGVLGGSEPCGVLVQERSPHALARALIDLLNDRSRLVTLSEKGRERALHYAWPRVVDQIEEVYREVLEK